jgi:hypothetical protein
MARTSRTTSNAQENEGQRKEGQTSADSTSMISGSGTTDAARLDAKEEQAAVQEQVDAMLGKEEENTGAEKISVKTLGPYMLQDPTTGDIVEESGSEVIKTSWIMSQLEAGRIKKA